VAGELALILVLDAKEHVIVLPLVDGFAVVVPAVISGPSELIRLHPDRVQYGGILSRLQVPPAESLAVI